MKRTNLIFVAVIIIGLILGGCATTQRSATPSGKPEVNINTTDRGKIKAVIINEFMNAGFTMVSESDYGVVFSKPMEGFGGIMYQAMLGNSYSSFPKWNARINMATIGNSTRVMAQAVVRMQNAFGREDVNDMTNGKAGAQLQEILQRIKDQVEAKLGSRASAPKRDRPRNTAYSAYPSDSSRISQSQDYKIAVVDMQEFQERSKAFQNIRAFLKKRFNAFQEKLDKHKKRLRQLEEMVSNNPSLKTDLEIEKERHKNLYDDCTKEMKELEEAARNKVGKDLEKIIVRMGDNKGYDFIIGARISLDKIVNKSSPGLLYVNNRFDPNQLKDHLDKIRDYDSKNFIDITNAVVREYDDMKNAN